MIGHSCEFEGPIVENSSHEFSKDFEGWEFKACGRPAAKFLNVVRILGVGSAGFSNPDLSAILAACNECFHDRLWSKGRMFLYHEAGEEDHRRFLVRQVLES